MSTPPCLSLNKSEGVHPPAGFWDWASESLEIGIGTLCSLVTWQYTVQNDLARGIAYSNGHRVAPGDTHNFLFHPSAGLMLASCLIFGCCVSSFIHRRQDKDPFQFVFYLVLLAVAASVGYGFHASVHLILLGYLPWATCAAMALSISAHSLHRRIGADGGTGWRDEEKAQLLA